MNCLEHSICISLDTSQIFGCDCKSHETLEAYSVIYLVAESIIDRVGSPEKAFFLDWISSLSLSMVWPLAGWNQNSGHDFNGRAVRKRCSLQGYKVTFLIADFATVDRG